MPHSRQKGGNKVKIRTTPKEVTKFRTFWFGLRGIAIPTYGSILGFIFVEKDRFAEGEVERERTKSGAEPMIAKVIVFDEPQRLRWVYMNGERQRPPVAELFNFFVRVTKVERLAHVLVATSDTSFTGGLQKNPTLEGCAKYMLIDYFDRETTIRILAYGEGNKGVALWGRR